MSVRESAPLIRPLVPPSATLAIDEHVRRRCAAGHSVIHLGFGEAGLPVLPGVASRLAGAAGRNSYGPVAGSPALLAAAAGYFSRRALETAPEQVVTAPGSKALLFALVSVLPGDVVLPRPSWVSYAAQAALAGKRVLQVPIAREAGGVPDPGALREVVTAGRTEGRRPGTLILTLPDNPTGTLASPSLVAEVVEAAGELGLLIVCDEIYRDLAYDPSAVRSPAELAPDRVFVTSGLSKSMALGGWRIGFARLADGPLGTAAGQAVTGLASEVWSSLAAPMQEAATYVLDEPGAVRDHVALSRRLHTRVAGAAYERVVAASAECRPPAAAFYLYPDLERSRSALADRGMTGGAALADRLLSEHDIALLPGEAFGDDPSALCFRMATSLLYGADDDQRWTALAADEPEALPWVREPLDRLERALGEIG
jgi:aspartate aminotransferase